MAKVMHPDVCKRPTATQDFKDLKQAYDTLKDPELRREHEYALAKVATKDVEDDIIDAALRDYSIERPKKKKKKKKKEKSASQIAQEQQAQQQFQNYQYVPPPYEPPQPQYNYDARRGEGVWDHIPPGFDNNDTLGGIL